jgi:predicted DNA-binding transcriptional regulator AlpA
MIKAAPKTLNARGLSRYLSPLLHKTEKTIYRDISRRPDSLPPPSRISGRTKTWLVPDVNVWVAGGKIVTVCLPIPRIHRCL